MQDMVDKYKFMVRKIIRQKTGNANQDLEQEVFIRLWQKKDSYTEQGRGAAWVRVITHHVCVDYFKSKFFAQEKCHVEIPKSLCDDHPGPEDCVSATQRQRIVLKAVNTLPRKLRQVIILLEFEGLTVDQVARRLAIPPGTVKSRTHTAKQILAQKLAFLQPKGHKDY